MPRLRDTTRLQRRDHIADAAMRCFARDGIAKTSMADIIREGSSSAGSVYSNFESKADLVRYTSARELERLISQVSSGLPADRTPQSLLAHLLRASTDREHAAILLQIWAESGREALPRRDIQKTTTDLRSWIQTILLPWCKRQRAQVDPDLAADAVLNNLQGFLVRMAIDPAAEPDLLIPRIVDSLQVGSA